jgi:glycosyltransferase involved in cell wall biosynthesis
MTLSVVIITFDEESNLPRTLESVKWADEIIVVDSGSADRTVEIAKSYGAKVWVEPWKGFAAQKNSALEKATSDWILSLDADEEVSSELQEEIRRLFDGTLTYRTAKVRKRIEQELNQPAGLAGIQTNGPLDVFVKFSAFRIPRKNFFLGRWIRFGGFYPDRKLRLFRRGIAQFESRLVHEDINLARYDTKHTHLTLELRSHLLHHAYPTLSGYIEHMNRYSSLGAQMAMQKEKRGFSFINIVLRPFFTFIYNYVFRLGFLDGREGLLLHLYHSTYVSWKYAKLWERTRKTGN